MTPWGKRKDGQPYPKNNKKGILSSTSSTSPVADVHLKDRGNVKCVKCGKVGNKLICKSCRDYIKVNPEKFDIKIEPASDRYLNKKNDEHYKMNIDKENVWERISEIPEIIQANIRPNADKFIQDSEMDVRGQRWAGEVLDWCDGEFDLEVNNINWVGDFIEEDKSYGYEIHRVQKLVMESAMYWVDKGFGYEEESDKKPQNEGERLGAALFEIFKKMDEEKFENYDDRREDYVLSKKIVQAYVESQYQLLGKELDKIKANYKVK